MYYSIAYNIMIKSLREYWRHDAELEIEAIKLNLPMAIPAIVDL